LRRRRRLELRWLHLRRLELHLGRLHLRNLRLHLRRLDLLDLPAGLSARRTSRCRVASCSNKASSSLTGRWQWQADCGFLGRFFGDFRMTQSPGGHLTGQWLRDSGGTTGHIDGTVVGEKVSFTLQGGKDGLVRQYDAVLNSKDKPSRMIGSLRASVASCAFTASRD